jgi:transcription factor WhiB/helix-turn-helix protein
MTTQTARPEWGRSKGLDWMDQAACKANPSAEYAFIYGSSRERKQAIQTFCHEACPVREECLTFGVESMSEGVWGGVYRTMADAQQDNSRQSSLRSHDRGRVRSRVVDMYNSGLSMRKIAHELQRSEQLIKVLVLEAGLKVRGGKQNGSASLVS